MDMCGICAKKTAEHKANTQLRMGGIRLEWICVGYVQCAGYVWDMLGGIRLEWICVGYVQCAGYVWDMCGGYVWNGLQHFEWIRIA